MSSAYVAFTTRGYTTTKMADVASAAGVYARGWSPQKYAAWLRDALERLLLAQVGGRPNGAVAE
jgi:hypothetical protein